MKEADCEETPSLSVCTAMCFTSHKDIQIFTAQFWYTGGAHFVVTPRQTLTRLSTYYLEELRAVVAWATGRG